MTRALSWDVPNGIVVDLVLCGERKCQTCMIYWATNCRSSIRTLRALSGESLVGRLKFITHKWNFYRILARAVSRCLLNDIVIVLMRWHQLKWQTCMMYSITNCRSSLLGPRAVSGESLVGRFKCIEQGWNFNRSLARAFSRSLSNGTDKLDCFTRPATAGRVFSGTESCRWSEPVWTS